MVEFDYKEMKDLDSALMQLFDIVTVLRSEDGCPWDKEQTNKTVSKSLIDETYEYIDGLLKDDKENISEELGDILINVMMLLEIHKENGDIDIVKSINDVCQKLIRRHPHVFGDVEKPDNGEDVLKIWNKVKEDVEHRGPKADDFFSNVPSCLPQLEEAYEIQKSMKKVGCDYPDKQSAIDKICEELDMVIEEDTAIDRNQDVLEMKIGELLYAVINYARHCGVASNIALHRANEKIRKTFNKVCTYCNEENISVKEASSEELSLMWDRAEKEEN